MKRFLYIITIVLILSSCTKEIRIDTQEGPQLIGISGYITNEYKKHEVVISKTADFYSEEEIEMISGAEVFVYDGFDTLYYNETDDAGHYESAASFAGVVGRTYYLYVNIFDDDGIHSFHAESKMRENVSQIDSITIKDYVFGEFDFQGILGMYPYFQSLPDDDTYYLVNAAINDSLVRKSLLKCSTYSLYGLSGLYVNSEFMANLVGEQSVFTFYDGSEYEGNLNENDSLKILNKGDKVTMIMYSITPGFAGYKSDISSSSGSNPMMGMPYNVRTNIYPKDEAVGYFEAASVVTKSIIY